MKRRFSKAISIILTVAVLFATAVVPVSAVDQITVSTNMENVVLRSGDNQQIYKLVIKLKSPNGFNTMSTVLSFDNEVIVPVNYQAGDYADVTPTHDGFFYEPLNTLIKGVNYQFYTVPTAKSYINGSRTAFNYDISSTAPITSMVAEQAAFEFYFRIADGKTTADMNVKTFEMETDKSAGSFLDTIYFEDALPTHYGLMVYEPDSTKYYYPDGGVALTLNYTNSDQLITPTVTAWPIPLAITYGDTLADSTLTGGMASVPGTFSWAAPDINPTVIDSGVTDYVVAFTPLDTSTYLPVFSTLKVTVNPLQVDIPTVNANRTYTGLPQTPDINASSYYTVTGSATNAGTYNTTVSLTDLTNCKWSDGNTGDKILSWTIDPADYTVDVPTKEIKVGSPNTSLPGAVATGVNGEEPAGTLTWYNSVKSRDDGISIPENFIPTTPLGPDDSNQNYTIWWKFVTNDTNYISTPELGYTTITIINGDPQNIEITGKPASAVYGMPNFTLGATVTTTGDSTAPFGAITWSSSNESVATINASTGEVDVLTAGTTTITATAAKVDGEYAAGSITYDLDVLPVPLTVTPGTYSVTKVYDSTVAPGTGSGDLTIAGILAGDEADVTVSAAPKAYTSEDVGGDTEAAAALSLSGAKSGNYTLTSGTINVPCSITQRPITGVSVTSVTKTYDATTGAGDAAINGTPTLTGKVEGDDLGIVLTVTSFSDANVATAGKTASITLGALSGTDASNYSLTAASPITADANIVPATITGYSTPAPTATILANDFRNFFGATKLKEDAIVLPGTVKVIYVEGTADLPIIWANAQETYDIKGGEYTYKGTITNGSNFNAYATTLNAVLTVTPINIISIATVPGTLTAAKSTVLNATDHTDLGFPQYLTLSYDNSVSDTVGNAAAWDTTIDDIKALAGNVDESKDQKVMVTLTNLNFPEWATFTGDMPATELTITNKIVIPDADITFNNAAITFGDTLTQTATVDIGDYPGAVATYVYTGTGSTTYGPSATAPLDAGTYNVVATVQNDTHKGTKSATLTINRKTLDPAAIAAIPDQTYTGSALTPALTVTDGAIQLETGTDYTAEYSSNINAGPAMVTITGVGNYNGTATAGFTIQPKSIAFATITAADQTYNGGPQTPAYTVKDGDTTLALNTDYTFTSYANNTNAGTADIIIAGAGNYTGTATGNFEINKADYNMSTIGFADDSKVYNGAAQSIAITGTLPTGADTIQVTVSYAGSATNVSDGPQTITATFATTSLNYNTPEPITAVLTITPAEVTVSGIAANSKVYDGTTDATLDYNSAVLAGKILSDDLGIAATGTFADKNVAPAKTVALSNLTLTGTDAGNYVLADTGQQESISAAITAKEVTVSGITAENKVYDSNTTATVDTSGASFAAGKLEGDTLTVSTTGTFADANAGTGKTVTFGPLTLGGTSAGNYTLAATGNQGTTIADITAKPVTVTGITANDKTYDGNTTTTLNTGGATFAGIETADEGNLTVTATGAFVDKNAGSDKTVNLTGLTLGGTAAANYSIKGDSQATTTAIITAKAVTISSGITAANKVYDSTTAAVLNTTGAIITGKITDDDLDVSTTGTFADANAGTGKTVTFGPLTLGGTDAGNYTLAAVGNQTSTTADITAKPVTVTGITANDKIYDGNTTATVNTAGAAFAGIETTDAGNLTVTATGTFTDKNAGSDKTVNLTGLTLGGTAASNYSIKGDSQTAAVASITAKEVTVSGIIAADKTYDGTTDANIDPSGASFAGIVGGDTLTVTTTGIFADADAGVGKTITFSALTLGGTDAVNYTVKSDSQTTAAATINKAAQAPITISTDLPAILVGNSLTASAAGGSGEGTITYSVSAGPGSGTFAGSTFTATGAGNVSLIATKGTDTNYLAADSAPVTIEVSDKLDMMARNIDPADLSDALKAHLVNEGKYTVGTATRKSDNVNEFTVAVQGTAVLTAYESSDPAQGSGQWIGIILGGLTVNGGAALNTTAMYYSADGTIYTPLAAADLTEVQTVGGSDGDFILWLKSENVGVGKDIYIATDGVGANAAKVTITFTAYVPSSGGSGTVITPLPVISKPVTSEGTTTIIANVAATITGTTSTAALTQANMNQAVNTAVNAAAESGTTANVKVVVDTPKETTEVKVTLPVTSVGTLVTQAPTASITVESGVGAITFDGTALSSINQAAGGSDITIAIAEVPKKNLNETQQALVGDRPVIDLSVMSGGRLISDFKGGNATINIPYTLAEGESSEGIVIWYMTDEGTLQKIECNYDPKTKTATFNTGHFSKYVVAYFPFDDLNGGEWYYENAVYAYTNNLIAGVSSDRFDPLGKTTRAMVVTILWRLDGKPTAAPNGFADVPASWYSDAVSWASANGIASGYSSEKFGPNDPITREQMSAIIYNYGVYKGYDMSGRKALSAFADSSKVSAWAQNSMQWAVENGIISGTGTNKLDPAGSAQRAQVAAILQRFIENIAK